MIRFDRNAVTGFIGIGNNETEAIKSVKQALLAVKDSEWGELSITRRRWYLSTLKKPWRTGRIRIEEIINSLHAGYWLSDIKQNKYVVNTNHNLSS